MSRQDEVISVSVTREEWGAMMDALDIRTSQWGEMATFSDPCPERYEVDEQEAREMNRFYSEIMAGVTRRNKHV